jgi:hypothetical protein
MRAHIILFAVLVRTIAFPPAATADEKQDATQLEQLIAKIRSQLPAGWTVEFKLSREENPLVFMPQILVKSADKLPWDFVGGPGAPFVSADRAEQPPKLDPKIVEIDIALNPYLSPQDYAKAHDRNDILEQRRRQFEVTRLKLHQSHFKGGFTPAGLVPKSPEEARAIREYAMLWLATEPQRLPTHHYGTLSFSAIELHGIFVAQRKIYQPEKHQEYQQIKAMLEKLLVPYEEPRERSAL